MGLIQENQLVQGSVYLAAIIPAGGKSCKETKARQGWDLNAGTEQRLTGI